MVAILPLSGHHNRKAFDCGNADLNQWFLSTAKQHRAKGISSTYVAVESDASTEVFGFYALSVAELRGDEIPPAWITKFPKKIPIFRLGRLAVDTKHQGKGLGPNLLANAISRAKRVSVEVGGIGILVDAKPTAVGFYEQYGFEQLEDHPLKLFLRI